MESVPKTNRKRREIDRPALTPFDLPGSEGRKRHRNVHSRRADPKSKGRNAAPRRPRRQEMAYGPGPEFLKAVRSCRSYREFSATCNQYKGTVLRPVYGTWILYLPAALFIVEAAYFIANGLSLPVLSRAIRLDTSTPSPAAYCSVRAYLLETSCYARAKTFQVCLGCMLLEAPYPC